MALLTWWRGDRQPVLTARADLRVTTSSNASLMADLAQLETDEIYARLRDNHHPYVAWINGVAVAYGWVARRGASIGELRRAFEIPPGSRYLWDFATLPAWRGQGIYPRLLQAIVGRETSAERFWIIHAPENRASARGIEKAGFARIGELSFLPDRQVRLAPDRLTGRATLGAALLDIPLVSTAAHVALAPCWRCVISAEAGCATTIVHPHFGHREVTPAMVLNSHSAELPYASSCGTQCTCAQLASE